MKIFGIVWQIIGSKFNQIPLPWYHYFMGKPLTSWCDSDVTQMTCPTWCVNETTPSHSGTQRQCETVRNLHTTNGQCDLIVDS